ncbi:MAG TPA: PEGA domain-containing protein [Polyangiaceae bacterium]|nr:PEGA domain-containing protein [Polyangiaceae bacterium]
MATPRRLALALSFLVGLAPLSAAAQSPRPEPSERQIADARSHYERGLALYDEGANDAALVEFEKAYELAPSYKIRYNIGLVYKHLADYAGALRHFELYLSEGGAAINEARRKEVERNVAELRARVGTVSVSTNVAGAEVFVDDVSVGKAPLDKPLTVNPGRRKFSATAPGRTPAVRVISVAGSVGTSVSLELAETRTVVLVEKSQRRVPWVGWGATALLAIGAGTTGYLAVRSASDLRDARDAPNADDANLDSKGSKVRTFGAIADVCTIGAVVAGGVSLYYTIKWGKDSSKEAPPGATGPRASSLRVDVRPQGVALTGTF